METIGDTNESSEIPVRLDSQSWPHEESGYSHTGIRELDAVVGPGHGCKTVKPLRLIKNIIQIWCPPDGLVLDPFAESGTTGHAVLELNQQVNAKRRFILIADRNRGRHVAVDRIRRCISGD